MPVRVEGLRPAGVNLELERMSGSFEVIRLSWSLRETGILTVSKSDASVEQPQHAPTATHRI